MSIKGFSLRLEIEKADGDFVEVKVEEVEPCCVGYSIGWVLRSLQYHCGTDWVIECFEHVVEDYEEFRASCG